MNPNPHQAASLVCVREAASPAAVSMETPQSHLGCRASTSPDPTRSRHEAADTPDEAAAVAMAVAAAAMAAAAPLPPRLHNSRLKFRLEAHLQAEDEAEAEAKAEKEKETQAEAEAEAEAVEVGELTSAPRPHQQFEMAPGVESSGVVNGDNTSGRDRDEGSDGGGAVGSGGPALPPRRLPLQLAPCASARSASALLPPTTMTNPAPAAAAEAVHAGREGAAMGRVAAELDEWGMAKGLGERARVLLETRRAAAARERGRAEAAEEEAEARARSESEARALVNAWNPPPWRSVARPRLEAKGGLLEGRLEEEG